MNLNFKQALEQAKYLLTPEGKAEALLQSTIDTINKGNFANGIHSISFDIFADKISCKLYSHYYNHILTSKPCTITSITSSDLNEIISIYQIIENKLKEEGYTPNKNFAFSELSTFKDGFKFNV